MGSVSSTFSSFFFDTGSGTWTRPTGVKKIEVWVVGGGSGSSSSSTASGGVGAGSTSGVTTIDVNQGGASILSTKLTIDYGELTSYTGATPVVISTTALTDNNYLTVDIDGLTGGADETGLKIQLIGTLT